MKKLQQFFVFKFDSERLKAAKYNIQLNLDEARRNNEVVAIAYNQVIKTVLRLTKREYNQENLDELLKIKSKLKKKSSNAIFRVLDQIDDILFIPELVSIQFQNKSHYKNIIEKGLIINDKSFVRLLAGAGNIRRNTVIFCDADIKDKLVEILDNGRNKNIQLVPAKYNAYFALLNSSALPVSFPKFAVVKDCTLKTTRNFDYIVDIEDGDDYVEENKKLEISCNAFDGQGLISPALAKKWSQELELDYIPANFIIRGPFIKGMIVTFDFHDFSETVANKCTFTDIYNKEICVDDVELILSESQFKLWNGYSSLKEYSDNCRKNELGFGISRVSPKHDKNHVRSNYQFLQVLNLDNNEIESLCQPTLDYLKSLSSDSNRMLLYSMGQNSIQGRISDFFDGLDTISKMLILEPNIVNDKYVKKHFKDSVARKVKDSYLGSLYFSGNYSTIISDPFAQAEHIFGMPVKGLLKDDEYYSSYWNKRKVNIVAACRAPLTFQSEVLKLSFVNDENRNHWYKYINSGIIFPAFGIGIDGIYMAD